MSKVYFRKNVNFKILVRVHPYESQDLLVILLQSENEFGIKMDEKDKENDSRIKENCRCSSGVECFLGKEEVSGSIPDIGSIN